MTLSLLLFGVETLPIKENHVIKYLKSSLLILAISVLASCNSQPPHEATHATLQPSATGAVQVPSGFSAPIYPESIAKIVYGPADMTKSNEDVTVILQSQDGSEKIIDFYKAELPKRGWKVSSTTANADGTTIEASNSTQILKVQIADNPDARMINLTVGPAPH